MTKTKFAHTTDAVRKGYAERPANITPAELARAAGYANTRALTAALRGWWRSDGASQARAERLAFVLGIKGPAWQYVAQADIDNAERLSKMPLPPREERP